jgi:hypothetical protein
MCYPIVKGDLVNQKDAYLALDLKSYGGPGIVLNVWRNGSMVFSPSSLLLIDGNGYSDSKRFEPQMCASIYGGAYIAYTVPGPHVKVVYIPHDVATSADCKLIAEFPGQRVAIAEDYSGMLHLAYLNSGLKYRTITL